jgi:hypothetical protein
MKSTERDVRVGETKREQGSYFFIFYFLKKKEKKKKKKEEKNDVGGLNEFFN